MQERPDDIDACCNIAKKIGALRQQELMRLVRSIAEVRANLTPEQLERLEKTRF